MAFSFTDLIGPITEAIKGGAAVGTAAVTGKYNAATAAAMSQYGAAGGGGVSGGVAPIVIQTGGAAAPAPQEKTQSEGMPAWGWIAIAVAATGLLVGAFLYFRKKG